MPIWIGEALISVILIVFAVTFYIISNNFPAAMNPVDVGPAAFPRLMAGLTILLGLAQLLMSIFGRAKDRVNIDNKWSFFLSLILTLIYLYLVPRVGYFHVTPIFLLVLMLVLGNRKWVQLFGTALGFALFSYYVFFKFLQVALPV
ncbi:MAG: putative tricarboxylic transport rane protein [Clostridia bacterium]|nr:putative tricarboxylic transport rane protein [Clostridia bacterium]